MKLKNATITLGLIFFLLPASSFAEIPKLKEVEYQSEISALVANFMALYHYEGMNLNNTISRRLFKNYLDNLDYNRMFFTASDIREFEVFETTFDDDLRSNPVALERAFYMYNRFRDRLVSRMGYVLGLLEKDFNFSKQESLEINRHDGPWTASRAELDDLWRRRIKEEILRLKLRGREQKDAVELLQKRYKRLRKEILEEEAPDVLERFLSSVSQSFDPHSSYLKPITKENFDISMGHSLEGIGATLIREGEYTVIFNLFEGGPAKRSGEIHPTDKIIAVAQADEEAIDVVDMRLDRVVKQIRGKKGTKVRLTLIPGDATDQSQTKEVILIRDKVAITTNDAKLEIKEVESIDGKVTRLGVIDIPSFYIHTQDKMAGKADYKSTTRDVRKLIDEMKGKDVDGLVIDLRRNGGGSLDEAIDLTGLFISKGPVVQVRSRDKKVSVERDPDPKTAYSGPLIVLTGVLSASASEIFAGAIQDYERGIVVGAKATHGKGTVQQLISLHPTLQKYLGKRIEEDVAGAMKLTTHKFYRISGASTQYKGVRPDITMPSVFDDLDITEDKLDYSLPWDEIQAVPHDRYGMVNEVLPLLKSSSVKRISENAEFRYVLHDLEERKKLREKNSVSLHWETRVKEKEEREASDKAREEERKLRVSMVKSEEPAKDSAEDDKKDGAVARVTIPDYELEEAVYILRDYVSFLKLERVAGNTPKKNAL